MTRTARLGLAALTVALIATGAAAESASPMTHRAAIDGPRIENADDEPGSWLTHGRTYQEDRFSPLDEISDKTVKGLSLAWFYDLDTDRGQEATPLVADGVMYTTSAWSKVFALDAATGKLLWSYDPEVKGRKGYEACCDVVNRGIALWDGKVYLGALDGRLIALDAVTGKPVWSVQTAGTSQQYTITGAPRVVRGKVLIGNGGAELGVRGFVSAYDTETGTLVWRFYTAPNAKGEPDHAASDEVFAKFADASWGKDGGWKDVGGGGTVWDAIVYDQNLNQILIGVGSGSPWSQRIRSGDGGDNLFLSSIVALDPDTGAYKWHYQEVPGEEWDFDATQPIILTDVKIDGALRKVLFQAAKDGFFYVIDRETGKPISATNFVPGNWSYGYDTKTWRPKVRPVARYSENGNDFLALASAYGAHNWNPMAYSPKTGLVYIPVQLIPFGYADDKAFKYVAGRWNLGDASAHNIGPRDAAGQAALKAMAKGRLLAWDPVKGKARFAIEHPGPGYGGLLATAGNLVFQGGPDGQFTAYRADTGKKLWDFDGQSGIIAGPIAFETGGQQFVAVMAGLGGSFGVSSTLAPDPHKRPNGRVLVFKLGGTASLPAYTRPVMPAQVPDGTFPSLLQAKGEDIYASNCGLCHGPSTYSNGVIPDLRRSAAILSQDTFDAIVLEGALEPRGMISFSKWLNRDDTAAIRAYIAGQAKALRTQEVGDTAGGKTR